MATWTAASVVPRRAASSACGDDPRRPGQDALERLEDGPPARPFVVAPQSSQDALQQGQRPVPLEEPLRRLPVGRFEAVVALGVAGVDRQHRPPAPAAGGDVALALVGEEVRAVGQQERPEAAAGRVGRRDGAFFQKACEVGLGQVEGTLRVVPLAADEGVQRVPVRGAELGQRLCAPGASPPPAATTRLQRVVGNRPSGLDKDPDMTALRSQVHVVAGHGRHSAGSPQFTVR